MCLQNMDSCNAVNDMLQSESAPVKVCKQLSFLTTTLLPLSLTMPLLENTLYRLVNRIILLVVLHYLFDTCSTQLTATRFLSDILLNWS